MSTPWERLREERARLGLNQEAFGALGGVRKQAQIKYEKGERKPDSSYLEGIASAGADVDYILTGTHHAVRAKLQDIKLSGELGAALGGSKEEVREVAAAMFSALEKARAEGAEEQALLDDFRRCSPEDQRVIRQMTTRLAVEPKVAKRPARRTDQPSKG